MPWARTDWMTERSYPRQLPQPEYPTHFETRVAYPSGVISFGTTQWYVSNCVDPALHRRRRRRYGS
jgi:hypothetical protein